MRKFVFAFMMLGASPAIAQTPPLQEAEMLRNLAKYYCGSRDLDLRKFACQAQLRYEQELREARVSAVSRRCEAAKILYGKTAPDEVTLECDRLDVAADAPEICTLNNAGDAYNCDP